MPEFCDVALPVPLDMVFTYRVPAESVPVVGGRVLVPFRQQRMTGVVVELHDRKPAVATKNLLNPLDQSPVLDDLLLRSVYVARGVFPWDARHWNSFTVRLSWLS